jgi:hypothetical protein
MAKIKLTVEMRSGTGFGLWVTVDNKSFHFTESGEKTLTLSPNFYVATIGGYEPTTALVTITFSQGEKILAQEEYKDPTFFGFIALEVK